MERTKTRALVTGMASVQGALLFAICLALVGTFTLAFFTNFLTVAIALLGFFVYVILYSFSKYRSIHGTLIGSIAGAVPPVVGYSAVSNRIDLGACLFFTMMALWQMPHFLAIAIYRLEDYAAASLPVLPIQKGLQTTKIHMLLYIIAFMMTSFMLTVFDYTGYAYLVVAGLLGTFWLWLCIQGLTSANDKIWARKMFLFSLVIVISLCLMIPFSVI